MIVATTEKYSSLKIHGACNRGETLGTPWVIIIISGISSFHYLVIAQNEQDALDVYADSPHSHMTKLEVEPSPEEEDWYTQLGNFSEWYDPSNISRHGIQRCKLNYFAKKEDLVL
jgi:hypothetical protein